MKGWATSMPLVGVDPEWPFYYTALSVKNEGVEIIEGPVEGRGIYFRAPDQSLIEQ